jgi:Spy/CpxP family protein refolding chaperone
VVNAWKPILAALVIFAAGVVTGGLTIQIRQPRPSPYPGGNTPIRKVAAMPREAQLRELSRRMQAELDLAPEQRDRIEAIVRDSQERMKSVRDEVGKKIGEEFREMRQKIRTELTPDQRRKFAEIMKQHDERDKRDDRSARPSPPAAGKSQ